MIKGKVINWQQMLKKRVPEERRSDKKRVPGGGVIVSKGCILASTSVGSLLSQNYDTERSHLYISHFMANDSLLICSITPQRASRAVLLFPKNANLQDIDGGDEIGSGFARS
jgi:hypothetical protein